MGVRKVKIGRKNGAYNTLVNHANVWKFIFWTPKKNTLFFHICIPKVILLFRVKMYELRKDHVPIGEQLQDEGSVGADYNCDERLIYMWQGNGVLT